MNEQRSWRDAVHLSISRIQRWAETRADVRALVLVGSQARGDARPDSDIDIVMLAIDAQPFLNDLLWLRDFGVDTDVTREPYGRVTSLRFRFDYGSEVELSIAPADWAAEPIDAGTDHVMRDGSVVLLDRDGDVTRLRQRIVARNDASSLDDVVRAVEAKRAADDGQTLLLAIDGRGGSGKSTIAERLQERLESAVVVHLDDFVSETVERQRLLQQVILPLKVGQPIRYQRFDWTTRSLAEWTDLEPGDVLIIEGVSTLHPDLRAHFDIAVWLECPAEVGFRRGLARDRDNYGVDTRRQWVDEWMPAEERYIATHRPQDHADFIIDTSRD
jgi:uridine kinase